jgi:hypothetical protein
LSGRNASFPAFQKEEFSSLNPAAPLSPISVTRASGLILRKGTAVVIVLMALSWAGSAALDAAKNELKQLSFHGLLFEPRETKRLS